jgi:hypothetical protein
MGAHPGASWLSEFMAAAFEGDLAADEAACANVMFCVSSLDMDFLAVRGGCWVLVGGIVEGFLECILVGAGKV